MSATPPGRITGIDLARAIAILGMFAMHTFYHESPDLPVWRLFEGNSSVLFCVLAGVSVTFIAKNRSATDDTRQLITRGVILFAVGLLIAFPAVGPIVILTTYGVLYFLVAPWAVRLPLWCIAPLTVITMIGTPLLSWRIRQGMGAPWYGDAPGWHHFISHDWNAFWSALLLTGTFPVLTWIPFLLVGIIIGKHLLRRPIALFLGGAALYGIGRAVSWYVAHPFGFLDSFREQYGDDLTDLLLSGAYGVTPTESVYWDFIDIAHSGSITDIATSVGVAAMVIAVCLVMPTFWLTYPLRCIGRMPLTIYVLHILAIGWLNYHEMDIALPNYAWANLLVPILIASLWFVWFKRGPLEVIMSVVAGWSKKRERVLARA